MFKTGALLLCDGAVVVNPSTGKQARLQNPNQPRSYGVTDYRQTLAFGLLQKFEAYRHEVEQYAAIANFCPIPVFVTSHDGTTILYVNPAYITLTGCDVTQLQDFGWLKVIHREDRQSAICTWSQFIIDRKPVSIAEKFINVLTGEIRACVVSLNMVPNNGLVGYVIPENWSPSEWYPRQDLHLQPTV